MPRQSRPGIRDRRAHPRNEDFRRADLRVLRKRQADLRRAKPQRIHACVACVIVQKFEGLEIFTIAAAIHGLLLLAGVVVVKLRPEVVALITECRRFARDIRDAWRSYAAK
jgi:hypothetical protein